MCGFAGFVVTSDPLRDVSLHASFAMSDRDAMERVATRMAQAIAQRGPDDAGAWADESFGVAFGHRRLSVVDLSPAGHQPMVSISGRYTLAFNGEIYNHLELRGQIENINRQSSNSISTPQWRGHSDTETLLAGFEAWGVEVTLQKSNGMFAFALWDKQTQTLTLARDRLGEKPLYYGWTNGAFVFGSELKALREYPGFANPLCRQALAQYLRFMYVPAPRSIYQGIYKLEPGCLLTMKGKPPLTAPSQPIQQCSGKEQNYGNVQIKRWWSLADAVISGAQNPISNEKEGLEQLEAHLIDAVRLQSLADVPLGAFLSGGVDSSTIAALMQQQSSRPVKTFTIGFDEAGFDESPYASAVAKHLGSDHHEMRVTAQMAQSVIANLPEIYDEPFADSSQIPTHLVSKLARQNVTVALSGDAGDELFGGYSRYFWVPRIWNRLSILPSPARKFVGKALSAVPVSFWNDLGSPVFGNGLGVTRLGDKVHRLADRMRHVNDMDGLYRSLVSEWADPGSLVLGENGERVIEPHSLLDMPLPLPDMQQPLPMMYQDAMTYLSDDILCKVDRAAMACSLETRVPFLDHRVVELAWQLPLNMKVRGNTGKWALRQVLYKYVPKELIERPKAGFAIPIGQWLRGPLREWAEGLINEKRLVSEGYLRPETICQAWSEHLSGRRDHTAKIWSVLMFQAWLEKNH
jgi:asparagine synthase (glutamine-hydrolysing)